MREKEELIKDIVNFLDRYAADIKSFSKFNWNDSSVHAEYFLKNLLNHIFDWKLTHVGEKLKPNTPAIDLFSEESGRVVQVTSQSTDLNKKITKTISDFENDWKENYPRLIIFIITRIDNKAKKYSDRDDVEILYFENLIEVIAGKIHSELNIIHEFIFQELSLNYNRGVRTLECIDLFKKAKNGEVKSVVSNIGQYDSGLIYFTDTDKQIVSDILKSLITSKRKIALLKGAPCIGKTTLTFEVVRQFEELLIKPFYIDLSDFNESNSGSIKNDISKISVHDAIIIVDNTQENEESANKIYGILVSENIRALFITRTSSDDDLSDSISSKQFSVIIDLEKDLKNEYLKAKINGIITKRISYLKRTYPQNDWSVGSIENVYANSELNFLKLSIILYYWESDFHDSNLEEVNDERCYKSFYGEHGLRKANEKEINYIYKYSSLYKYDFPFILQNKDIGINQLIRKGVFIKLQYLNFYKLPHTEYAKLLAKAIAFTNAFTAEKEVQSISDYLTEVTPINSHDLINSLTKSGDYEIIKDLFSDDKCSAYLSKHYQLGLIKTKDIGLIFRVIKKIHTKENEQKILQFLERFIENTPGTKFKLNEKESEQAFNSLKQCVTLYGLSEIKIAKFKTESDKAVLEKTYNKDFFSLTELITNQTQNRNTVSGILSSLSFNGWKQKFELQKSQISLIAEGLSNLQSNPLSRQLAIDLYLTLNEYYIFEKLKDTPLNVIGKGLSDLSEFDAIDFKSKPRIVFNLLVETKRIRKAIEIGLIKYSIAISHLNKVYNEKIYSLFPSSNELTELFKGATANELFQTIPIFLKVFPEKSNDIIEVLKTSVLAEQFIRNPKNDLNGIMKLIGILKDPQYKTPKGVLMKFNEAALHKLFQNKNLIHISEAGHKFKQFISDEELSKLINSNKIAAALENSKISLNHLEGIIHENLKKRSIKFAFELYKGIPLKVISDSAIAKIKPPAKPLSFEQITKVIFLMFKLETEYYQRRYKIKDTDYHAKGVVNYLMSNRLISFSNKADSAYAYDFITGYMRLYEIDSVLTEKYLFNILEKKSLQINIPEATLSNFPVALRKLFDLNSSKYKKIAVEFLQKSKDALWKNSDGLDLGQISTGLKELSLIKGHEEFAQDLFFELRELIETKAINEKIRPDYKIRIIPELYAAAGKFKSIVDKLSI